MTGEQASAGIAAQPFVAFAKADIEQSIPARFEQQVAQHHDRLAVHTALHSLTYQQLDRLANRVAHGILARRGSGSEPIGLLMQQGAPLIAAILGVLKAGKMYVPIDSSDPAARITFTVSDAGAPLILTDHSEVSAATDLATPGRSVVAFDELTASQPEHSPAIVVTADTPAYIYYTSGSTGLPKGVWDIHRNVLHNIMRYSNSLQISASDRLTLLQSPGFSGAVSSMFNALLNGAAIFPYEVRKEGLGRNLAEWLHRHQITMYHSVPMLFRSFLTGNERFPKIRVIRLEGDAATKVDVELYRKHFEQSCLLVNGLGATETGISRQFFMDRDTQLSDSIVPIGYGTVDMHGMVVDEAGQDIGMDAVGEIAIKSRYLASGYWNQPDLTRVAFLPGPAGSGERIYRTGDLGRMRSGGCLEYLGRKDMGVKIRGHRVEPAEVERALLDLEAVRSAAVVTREDATGSPKLVGYLVATAQPHLPVQILRQRLAESLPDYMIPTRFIFLDGMPVTANGKVDRAALPAPGEAPVERTTKYVAPRDPIESQLVKIWEELLHTAPIGVTDNFFDFGGDSLIAAALLTAVEEATAKNLPPASIIEAPTIAQLAQLAQLIRGDGPANTGVLVPFQIGGIAPPLFCVGGHSGHVVELVDLARHLDAGQPFYGLQSAGLSGSDQPLTSIEAMAGRNVEAVREVQPRGPYYLGGRCWGAVVALEMAHQLIAVGEPVGLLCLMNVTPYDFPGLVSGASRRRFWHRRCLKMVRTILRDASTRRRWKQLPYPAVALARILTQEGRHLARRFAARTILALRRPLPRLLRDVDLLNHMAFAGHSSRTYPGRALLILSEEHRSLYSANPLLDWKDLARGYDVHFVPGADPEMFAEPGVQTLAHHLQGALHAART